MSQAKIGKLDFYPMSQKIEEVSIFFPIIILQISLQEAHHGPFEVSGTQQNFKDESNRRMHILSLSSQTKQTGTSANHVTICL